MSQRPFKVLGIEHIGIAVESLEGISNIFSDFFGLSFIGSDEVSDQQVITDIYKLGDSKIEFLKPTHNNSHISRFINRKGQGIHHIAFKVDNLSAALEFLDEKGVELIDKTPRIGAEGLSIAFLHPKSTSSILIELCEKK